LAREKDDAISIIFKIWDVLGQNILILWINLWLENNSDLIILRYKVFPTELKAGFIECLLDIEFGKLQEQDRVAEWQVY